MDSWCAPQGIGRGHRSDERSGLGADRRTARSRASSSAHRSDGAATAGVELVWPPALGSLVMRDASRACSASPLVNDAKVNWLTEACSLTQHP
jgi:hypothetical protein